MDFRTEIEAMMSASRQQSDSLNQLAQRIREGQQRFDVMELVNLVAGEVRVQKEAILRIADEIDRLGARLE